MCKRIGESVNHIFLHCDVASAIWSVLFNRFGMPWVMPRRVIDLYDCWWASGRPRALRCGKWCLHASFGFCERNEKKFEDRERSMGDIISMFFETLCLWTAAYVSRMSISFSDYLFRFALSS